MSPDTQYLGPCRSLVVDILAERKLLIEMKLFNFQKHLVCCGYCMT